MTTMIHNEERYEQAVQARIHANYRMGKAKRWLTEDATREQLVERMRQLHGDFAAKMCDAYDEWGALTAGQEAAVRKMVAKQDENVARYAAERAKSEFVGEVGKRQTFKGLTLHGVFADEGLYGMTFAHTFTDAAGNRLIWRGTHRLVREKERLGGRIDAVLVEKGETVDVVATVKKHHTTKDGAKVTIITRAKLA